MKRDLLWGQTNLSQNRSDFKRQSVLRVFKGLDLSISNGHENI